MGYQQWAEKQKGRPRLLGFAAIFGVIGVVIVYRSFYKPWRARYKLTKARKNIENLLKD